jgi:protein phosphatase
MHPVRLVGGLDFLELLPLVQTELDLVNSKSETSKVTEDSSQNAIPQGPLRWGAATDIGKVRDENEDTFLIEAELGLFLVSDGMGGHKGGALAANIVAEDLPVMIENRLNELKSDSPRAVKAVFKKTIIEQSRQLRLEGTSETGHKGMGATLVVALVKGGRAHIANLGDSRMYRFRNGRLTQLTKDHSVVSELLRQRKIQLEEAEDHAAAGEITGYVGMEEKVAPYVRSFMLRRGDRLLLSTDGLTAMVDNRFIASVLAAEADCQAACEALVSAANAAGGHDNITVVVVDWQSHPQ